MDPLRSLGMKQIEGGDITSLLTPASFFVMGRIPARGLLSVQAEVMNFLARWKIYAWMLSQQFLEASCTALLSPYY